MPRVTVAAFVTGVSIPRKGDHSVAEAFIGFEDDADCHPFKVAVPLAFAKKMIDALTESEDKASLTIDYPSDGEARACEAKDGPVLRPHDIPGWWQVWDGGLCIALLRPEDLAPVIKELMKLGRGEP